MTDQQPTAKLSQAEDPQRLLRKQAPNEVTVEDVRQLMGASTPHFALQLRNRIAKLIAGLPADHPARVEGEREIARLERLGFSGETRGEAGRAAASDALPPLPVARRAPSHRAAPDAGPRPRSASGREHALAARVAGSVRAAV